MGKIFPYTILQATTLLFAAAVLTAPTVFLKLADVYSGNAEVLLLYIVFFIFAYLIWVIVNRKKRNSIDLGVKSNFSSLGLLLLCILSIQAGIILPLSFLTEQLIGFKHPSPQDRLSLYTLSSAVIIGPAIEEIVFRGIILKGFLSNYPVKKAIVYSSILFALVHGNPVNIAIAFIIGSFLSIVYAAKRNIMLSILLHSSINLSTLLIKQLVLGDGDRQNDSLAFYGGPTGIVVLIALAVSSLCFSKLKQTIDFLVLK